MSPSKLSTRFVIFVVVSLMTHLLELAASGVFCHTLMQQTDLRMPWFSVAAGLLILPIVAIQLASAVFLLRRKGETSTSCEIATTAILHVLQLGFISRHFIILRETSLSSKRKEIIEMMLLRVSFAFTSGSTLFFVQVYLLLQGPHEGTWIWAVYFSGVTNLISVAWAVSTSRQCLPDPEFSSLLITWPGSLLKFCWRAGELLSRIISAALFASLYIHFLFLVIGLHWLSMLLCLYIPMITSIQWPACGSLKKTLIRLMISFTHIFTFINTSAENSVFRYTFYYVIFFLENATLITVWFVQSPTEYFSVNSIFAYVAVVAFIVSVTSMIIYYKYVHIPVSKASPARRCENSPCMTCNLADTANCQSGPRQHGATESNSSLTETPISLCSYQPQHKHYFVQDSADECNGCVKNTKGRSCRHNASSLSQSNTENTSSSLEEADNKYGNKHEYTALELQINSAGVQTEQTGYQFSQKQPVWLPSGDSNFANQLLTYTLDNFDAAETADSERSSDVTECVGYPNSRLSPPQTAAYEQSSIAGTSNTSQQVNQQRQSQALTCKIELTNACDSENICTCSCPCEYEISEVPPPEYDASSIPESEVRTMKITSPCLHADIHRHHYHYHHHHHGALHKNISPVTANENLPNLETENNNHYPSKDKEYAQEFVSCIQPPSVSSPNCYKNKKRKHSQKRKLHISTAVDTFTSLSTSTEQHSCGSNPAQDPICSPSRNIDLSLAQNDRLAMELLKSSVHSENHAISNISDTATVPTSDPRFSVRVMTSPVPEHSTCVNLVSTNTSNKVINTPHDSIGEYSELGPRKLQETDTNKRKTLRPGICRLKDVVTRPENQSCPKVSYGVQDTVSIDQNNRTDVSNDREDNVYENIWPTKERNKSQPSKGWDSYRMTVDGSHRKSDRREIYSESEDSALPMEFLSSSAEVFTGSNSGSDISLEIVI